MRPHFAMDSCYKPVAIVNCAAEFIKICMMHIVNNKMCDIHSSKWYNSHDKVLAICAFEKF